MGAKIPDINTPIINTNVRENGNMSIEKLTGLKNIILIIIKTGI
jgi:hypothetical protein